MNRLQPSLGLKASLKKRGHPSLNEIKIGELKRPKYYYIMHVNSQPNLCYCVNPTQEDSLVLMALGMMLNTKIVQDNLLMENSLGLKTRIKDYLGLVCSRVNVSILYKLDLTNSMKTINRDSLLSKLSHIVKDEAMKFISRPIPVFIYQG